MSTFFQSEVKMKEGIFVGAQITQLFEKQAMSKNLTSTGRRPWKVFGNFCRNFLGNEKSENYGEILQEPISSYSAVGCNVSLKLNFPHHHLNFLP
jgi:hypothetical protein